MRKSTLNKIITNPEKSISKISKKEIIEIKEKFPYCEIIHYISLLKSRIEQDINFTEVLAVTSLYSSNRKQLYNLIHPIKHISKKIIQSYKFEDWLKKPSIKTEKNYKKLVKENILSSTKDNDNLTTETLAELYIEQGHYDRAIQAYEILCLKYPKKSSFFADHIREIKKLDKE